MKTLTGTAWLLAMLALFCASQQASAHYDPGIQRWINRDPLADPAFVRNAFLGTELLHSTSRSYVFVANSPPNYLDAYGLEGEGVPKPIDLQKLKKWCAEAKKLLEQYRRLADKFGCKIPEKRLAELNAKRDAGTITSNDLPGTLRKEFPGRFLGLSLDAIEKICDEFGYW